MVTSLLVKALCSVIQTEATPTIAGEMRDLFTEADRQYGPVWGTTAKFSYCRTAANSRVDSKDSQILSFDNYRSRQHDKDLGTGRG